MAVNSLEEMFIEELKDVYNAENQILKALPRMAKKASAPELRRAFEQHLRQTEGQVQRLERVFATLDEKVKGKSCKGMQGIIEEGKEVMSEDIADDVLDAALIAAAQKVEHYEMATYGTLRAWAETLGNTQAAKLLQQTLDEEEAADEKLTQLAEQLVNAEAVEA